ncbi:MAG TPA: hypothetical protein VK841_24030 [Polyangiaceae bacterium]|nr:hypothetical protein [Polyangiaceae bacterium]
MVASAVLVALPKGQPQEYDPSISGLAANGFGDHSPGHCAMSSAFVAEVVLTFVFVTVPGRRP